MGLYIETRIRVDPDELWDRTQRPDQHQRWDLRFTTIDYLPSGGPDQPQRFRYTIRPLPGLTVAGTGVTAGDRHRPDGTRTSALRFASPHPLSPLVSGHGYWRYVPESDRVRFLTGYDYRPNWGWLGRRVDQFLVRPLMCWATAWSFDRLRLWCERGITPERALRNAWGEIAIRIGAVALTLAMTVALAGPVLIPAAVGLAAIFLPPMPTTPAARRCVRRHRTKAHRRAIKPKPAPNRPATAGPGIAQERS